MQVPDWYVFQCDCKTWITDRSRVNCEQCDRLFCGSREQLNDARVNNQSITLLKSGYGNPDITELRKELDTFIYIELFDIND